MLAQKNKEIDEVVSLEEVVKQQAAEIAKLKDEMIAVRYVLQHNDGIKLDNYINKNNGGS